MGLPVASTAPLARITDAFGAAVRSKDDVMDDQLQHFTAAQGVVFIGRAQEKTSLFRTEKRRDSNGRVVPPS